MPLSFLPLPTSQSLPPSPFHSLSFDETALDESF